MLRNNAKIVIFGLKVGSGALPGLMLDLGLLEII